VHTVCEHGGTVLDFGCPVHYLKFTRLSVHIFLFSLIMAEFLPIYSLLALKPLFVKFFNLLSEQLFHSCSRKNGVNTHSSNLFCS
jgi:hypothetical protein